MKRSSKGIYCGPLRLLAWEIAILLRSKNILCSLITGQERDLLNNSTHISCTIEMTDLFSFYDCAVIDEIQVIGDDSRGWAWTQTFLGLQSKTIHLCGNKTYLSLVEKLCQETNDDLIVQEYQRKSPLYLSNSSLFSFKEVRKGDCIVAFSRKELYSIKNIIEQENPLLRCCII